ncbi:MAG: TolC family protein [Muribaculaceae bacterium]|nr:TolC family protein [Muribaculaceae bacterium]
MNNSRLLTGLVTSTLLCVGVRANDRVETFITLDELFTIAESHSAQLRPSITAEKEMTQAISEARSSRLPDIESSLSISYIGDGFTTARNLSDYQKAPIPHLGTGLSLNVTQPVYTGGAVTGAIEMAGLKSAAAGYATELQRDNIRFRLTGFYLDIYKFANLRQVVQANINQAQKVLGEMNARYEQGTALQNDITRYELLVSNLDLQLTKINNTLEILNHNLVVTAGLSENTVVLPDSTLLARALPVMNEREWQEDASVAAPSLRLAETEVRINRTAEKLVQAESLPKIGLRAGWTIDGPILVEVPPINRNLSYWYVGVGVSYNLSSLYKNNKSKARSHTATYRAQQQLEVARENTEMAIRADYVKYMEAYEELKTCSKSVELAERNYRTTATRYGADMALITDMLDAANSKLDAEQQLVNAHINIIYYYYKLLFSSGKI